MVEQGLAAALRCEAWETALRACAYLSWAHRIVGHLDAHVAYLEQGRQLMHDHPALRGTGAWVSWMSSRTMEAGFRRAIDEQVTLMDEILAIATDDYDRVRTLARKASTLSVYGRTEEAARVLAELDPLVARSGLDDALQLGVTVSLARGTVLREVGDLEGSVAAFAHALQAAERKGSREDAWLVRHRWAEAVRAAGDWEAAARAHREMFAETGMFAHLEGQVGAALCLGLSLLDGRRHDEADAVMDELAAVLEGSGHWAHGLVAGIRAAAAGLRGDRARALAQLQLAATTLGRARESWFGVLHREASSRGWDDVLAALEPLTPDRAAARGGLGSQGRAVPRYEVACSTGSQVT
jgi:tetratricopeptide (TPR) repeat protein